MALPCARQEVTGNRNRSLRGHNLFSRQTEILHVVVFYRQSKTCSCSYYRGDEREAFLLSLTEIYKGPNTSSPMAAKGKTLPVLAGQMAGWDPKPGLTAERRTGRKHEAWAPCYDDWGRGRAWCPNQTGLTAPGCHGRHMHLATMQNASHWPREDGSAFPPAAAGGG